MSTLQVPICRIFLESRMSIFSGSIMSVPISILASSLSTMCSSQVMSASAGPYSSWPRIQSVATTYSDVVCWFPEIPLILKGVAIVQIDADGSCFFKNSLSISDAEQPVSRQQDSALADLDSQIGAIA